MNFYGEATSFNFIVMVQATSQTWQESRVTFLMDAVEFYHCSKLINCFKAMHTEETRTFQKIVIPLMGITKYSNSKQPQSKVYALYSFAYTLNLQKVDT